MLNPRRVLTRAQLLDHVWDYDFGGDARVLETYISYLRKKLDPHGPPLIHTVRGVGYALRTPADVMRSLRARLVAGVLALAAVGLLLARRRSPTPSSAPSCSTASTQPGARGPPAPIGRELGMAGVGATAGPRTTAEPAAAARRAGRRARASGLPAGHLRRAARRRGKVHRRRRLQLRRRTTARPAELPRELHARARRHRDRRTATAGGRATACSPSAGPAAGTSRSSRSRCATSTTLDRLLLVEALVIAGVLLALGAARWCVVRVGLLPLDRIGAHGGRDRRRRPLAPRRAAPTRAPRSAGSGSRSTRCSTGSSSAFAEREASEDRLRRFIADASHELRTPLASIRGYAELFRMGAAREPEDVEKAMRRIEDEAARMGVLVEDLLTLARLDEVRDAPRAERRPRRARRATPSTTRARPRPTARSRSTRDGAGVVLGDPHQLRQVLANLLRNALVHTPAGTPIEVTVGARRARRARRGARPRAGPADRRPGRAVRALLARRGRARARAGPARASASRSSRGSSTRTAARVGAANAPGGGARSRCGCRPRPATAVAEPAPLG